MEKRLWNLSEIAALVQRPRSVVAAFADQAKLLWVLGPKNSRLYDEAALRCIASGLENRERRTSSARRFRQLTERVTQE